ncbi:ROK family protein, partial [bacterium]|nr:ROK family protein [bacterium]
HGITITSHQVQGWDGFPLKKFLHEQFHVPVFVQNDASIAGYAEAKLGAGTGLHRIFYMTIGSGIGGGLITNGVIDEGQGLGAAEIGHTWIPDPDTGEPEKLEQIGSGWSIGRRAQEALEAGEHSLLVEMCDHTHEIDAKIVYAAVERDDLLATAILDETCQALALAISNIIALLHPERVILGGGVSLMGALFWDNLQEKVRRHVFAPYAKHYEIVPAVLGEEVVVIGAILLGDSSE